MSFEAVRESGERRKLERMHLSVPMPSQDLAELLMRRLLVALDDEDYTFRLHGVRDQYFEACKRDSHIGLRLDGSRLLVEAPRDLATFVRLLLLEEVVGAVHDMKGAAGSLEGLGEVLAAGAVESPQTEVHASAGRWTTT
jgi:hypothetical protein